MEIWTFCASFTETIQINDAFVRIDKLQNCRREKKSMIKKVLHFFKLHSYPNAHIDVIRFCMFAVRLFSNMLPYTFSIALKLALSLG